MKFIRLVKATDESRKLFDDFRKYGWTFRGAKTIGQVDVDIVDKATMTHVAGKAIAVLHKGPFVSYLWHKLKQPRGVFMGWKIPD